MTRSDLQCFCVSEDDPRDCVHEPWSRGEFTYATNWHIIVRAPRLADVDENPKAPDTEKLFKEAVVAEWLPVPACAMPDDIDCPSCRGACCDDCDWRGKVENLDGMDVGNANFQQRYLAMIQGWEIAPHGPNPAWIRHCDADGLLMPKRT